MKKALFLLLVSICLAGLVFAGTNVSLGKSYVISPDPAPNYSDPEGKKFTDGSANFSWGDMVGFQNLETNPVVTIDLGELYEEISFVTVDFMLSNPSGVHLPYGFIVSVSEDGELFEDLGMGTNFLGEVKSDSIVTMYCDLSEFPGYGQFVRIELVPASSEWLMPCEISVFDGELPEDFEPVEKQISEDPDVISLGAPYMLIPIPSESYPDEEDMTVTDGLANYAWGDMIGFDNPEMNPTVIVDLGEPKMIEKVSADFMRSFASAVNLPQSLLVGISNDGENFEMIGFATEFDPYPPENEKINKMYWEADKPVEAQYVLVEIRPRGDAWTMLAEVTVYGK